MRREKYYFNPETLQYEKMQKPLKRKLLEGLFYLAVLSGLFIGLRLLLDAELSSPKIRYFTQKNSELRKAYSQLNTKITLAESFLSDVQKRDDKVYRSVFELEPIPSSVREAGFGGSEDYYSNLNSRDGDFVKSTARKLDELSTKVKVQSVSLEDLYLIAKEKSLLLERKPSIQPISPADQFWLTSTYGYRWDPFTRNRRMHHGIDLAGPLGLNIYAAGAGVVEVAEYNRHGYGKEVIINHGFGYKTVYAHLDEILVTRGQKIKRGEAIGTLGSTGRSTGPHLHYEIRKNGRPVNPMYYFYENISPAEYKMITSINAN
ncbi:MAG: M23 family metallopeptidase [Bacteroidales bacterium]